MLIPTRAAIRTRIPSRIRRGLSRRGRRATSGRPGGGCRTAPLRIGSVGRVPVTGGIEDAATVVVAALAGGEVLLGQSVRSAERADGPAPLVDALAAHSPLDLVLGPAGYGLPLVPGERVGERELSLMLLLRSDEAGARAGI